MKQVDNTMLAMLQMMTEMRPAQKAPKNTDSDSFRKMMDQQRQAAQKADAAEKAPQDTEKEQPVDQNAVEQKPENEAVPQEQMVWAALAAMQVPVVQEAVQPEQPVAEVQQSGPVAVMDATVANQQVQTPVQTVETPVEAQAQPQMMEQAPAVENAPAERVQEAQPQIQEVRRSTHAAESEHQTQEVDVEDAAGSQESLFRDIEAVPVKVGEAPAMEKAETAETVGDQLAKPLAKALEQGETRVEIQLTPESLGTVKIEVTRGADGGLHVVLSAENPNTQTLLNKHAASLQSALYSQSQESVRVEVYHTQENQQQDLDQGRNDQQGGQQQEQHQQQKQHNSQDFMQQLRLGLIPLNGEPA